MNEEEIKQLIEQLKAQGLEDDEIMDVFYTTFTEGKMDREDLETLANAMGYELTDDFKNDETPDPINEMNGEDAPEEGAEAPSEEQVEAAKEIAPGESEEEFKEKIEEGAPAEEPAKPEEESKEEDAEPAAEEGEKEEEPAEESEEDEWEKAQKMFKI